MCSYAPSDLRLAIALLQQPRRRHPPLLQDFKISTNPRWIPHAGVLPQTLPNVSTILNKCCAMGWPRGLSDIQSHRQSHQPHFGHNRMDNLSRNKVLRVLQLVRLMVVRSRITGAKVGARVAPLIDRQPETIAIGTATRVAGIHRGTSRE